MQRKYLLLVLLMLELVFNSPTTNPNGVVEAHHNTLDSTVVAWNSEQTKLAIGSESGLIRLIDIGTNKTTLSLNIHSDRITDLAWNPDNSKLASISLDDTVNVWNAETGEILWHLEDIGRSGLLVTWSPDGKYLITGFAEPEQVSEPIVQIWNASDGYNIGSIPSGTPSDLIWSKNGQTVAIATASGSILVFGNYLDPTTMFILEGQNSAQVAGSQMTHIQWNKDENLIMGGTLGGTVRLWDMQTHEVIFEDVASAYRGNDLSLSQTITVFFDRYNIAFSSISGNGIYKTWNLDTGENILDFNLGSHAVQAEVSPDKTTVAYVDKDNELHIVKINDLITEQIRLKIDECVATDEFYTKLNELLDNRDIAGFISQLEATDTTSISVECADELIEIANLLLENENP